MELQFEATRSFCYKFGRYTVLAEVQLMPEVTSGEEFRLSELAQRVIDKHLTPEQQQVRVKKAQSERLEPIHSIVKFFVSFVANGQGTFIKIGKTVGDVEGRVAQQCKGSASFDNPVILGRWQVNRVGPTELAAHHVLKARGKWRENAPGGLTASPPMA